MRATKVVIDASVALKWYLEDEEDRPAALRILNAWNDGRLNLVAPSFWPLEVANGLRNAATRKGRKLTKRSREYLEDFLAKGIPTIDVLPDIRVIYEQSLRMRISVYDTSYIHVAEPAGIDVVTADDRLVRAVRTSKPFVKHLRDYRLPPPFPDA